MLQGNPGTINPHLTARTYQPNPSYQYQTIGNENNSGPGLMISLQTPTHDPRLTVNEQPPSNLYKSYPTKLDRVQTPAHHRDFAVGNARVPSNQKREVSNSKSNSSGRGASSGKRRQAPQF